MKVVVLGAGALGSIIAGHLARAGEDVTLIARGDRARYLEENGITVTGLAEFNTPCAVASDPSILTEADVLIVAVKTHDTEAAITSLDHLKIPSVMSVQNGVVADAKLSKVFGEANTVGASASFSGEVLADGAVRFTVNAGFYIGELPDGTSERVQGIAAMLERSGILSKAVSNIRTVQWSKFVTWVGGMPVAVLSRLATYKFCSDPDSALICARLVKETAALADAAGIPLQDSPPMPIMEIISGTEQEAVGKIGELGARLESEAPDHRWSTLQDLERGRYLEVEETLGYVVAEAAKEGIPVPTVETCYRLINGINRIQQSQRRP